MAEIQSQSLHTGDNWREGAPRVAGLYGEMPPLPVPAGAAVRAIERRKLRLRATPID
jgi:hypothetical protein